MEFETVSWLRYIPLIPLLGAAVNLLFGARLQARCGKGVVHGVSVGAVTVSFALIVVLFVRMLGMAPGARVFVDEAWTMIAIEPVRVSFTLSLDALNTTLALVVTGVGALIHVFSMGYMRDEPSTWRFFGYLNLFIASMLTLTMADNLFVLFFGWEGVGLCSYLLIGFWYQNHDYAKAGMKAFVVNRIGDLGVVLGMLTLLWAWAAADVGLVTLSFRDMARPEVLSALARSELFGIAVPTLAALLLFLGCTGKSAQIPLYVWLPDAMAGPTPVSALIHAATMVTAGVYLVARMHFLFTLSQTAMTVVATVGVLTALVAATIGLFQRDIKKVLAYSTVSQLGFMFVGVGVGAFASGFFHLVTHAFFKAALFLGAGSVIMAMHHEQDLLKMGGLRKPLPRTWLAIAIGCWAIAGFPPLSGFFSKDEILWRALDNANTWIPGWFLYGVGLLTAGCTAFYMYRLYFLAFSGERAHDASAHGHAPDHADEHGPKESPATMTVPLLILAGLAAVAGFLGLPHMSAFEHWLSPVFQSSAARVHSAHYPHALEYALMAVSVLVALGGFLIARKLYRGRTNPAPERLRQRHPKAHALLLNKYYVDEAYDAAVVRPTLGLTRGLSWFDSRVIDGSVNGAAWLMRGLANIDGWIDKHLVDGAVNGLGRLVSAGGRGLLVLQTGRVQHYVLGASAGLVLILMLFQYVF